MSDTDTNANANGNPTEANTVTQRTEAEAETETDNTTGDNDDANADAMSDVDLLDEDSADDSDDVATAMRQSMVAASMDEDDDDDSQVMEEGDLPPASSPSRRTSSFNIPDTFLTALPLPGDATDDDNDDNDNDNDDNDSDEEVPPRSFSLIAAQAREQAEVVANFAKQQRHAAEMAAAVADTQTMELQAAQQAAQAAEVQAEQHRLAMEMARNEAARIRMEKEQTSKAIKEKDVEEGAETKDDHDDNQVMNEASAMLQQTASIVQQSAYDARKAQELQQALLATGQDEEAWKVHEQKDLELKELHDAAAKARALEAKEQEKEIEEDHDAAEAGDTFGGTEEDTPLPRDSNVSMMGDYASQLAVPFLRELEDTMDQHETEIFATFYEANGKPSKSLTFGKIWDDSGILSYHLRHTWKVQKGETVVLCLDSSSGLSYIAAWLGCLRAGCVPIIVASLHPPFDTPLTRMNLIMKAAAPIALVLTDSVVAYWKEKDQADRDSSSRLMWPLDAPWHVVDKLPSSSSKSPTSTPAAATSSRMPPMTAFPRSSGTVTPTSIAAKQRTSFFWSSPAQISGTGTDDSPSATIAQRASFLWPKGSSGSAHSFHLKGSYDEPTLTDSSIACLTHTAGSTGDPKVVAVTFAALHEAILMTKSSLSEIFGQSLEGFSWLPPDHHLGLFLGMVCPLFSACRMHYMAAQSFEHIPLQWINLMSTYKVAWTVAPDPAYRLLMRSAEEELSKSGNDDFKAQKLEEGGLSSLRHLLNIGEAARFDTQSKFRKIFGPLRLHKECSVTVGYSLTEHILAVSWVSGEFVVVPSVLNYSPTNWVAVARRSGLPEDVKIIVVDTSSKTPVVNGTVGEVWVSSPTVKAMTGYHRNRSLSKKVFMGRLKGTKEKFLRTGDLGFWEIDHYLYICGRKKDVMANNKGVKYYPPDIEWVVEDSRPEVIPGCVASFTSVGGTVEVVFEVQKSTTGETIKSVCQSVSKAVKDTTGIEPSSVVAVPEGSIPKTSSGLVERRITKQKLLKEHLTILHDYPERKGRISIPDIDEMIKQQMIPDIQEIIQKTKRQERVGERSLANLHEAELDNIISRYVGSGFDNELSWDELGLTSTSSVPMRRDLEGAMSVTLPPNCLEQHPTPAALKEHISENSGNPLMTDAMYLRLSQSAHLAWHFIGFLQGILSLLIIVLFTIPVLPCYIAFPFLSIAEPLYMLMVPMWMITFSFIVILFKWLVIGRYKECRIVTPSYPYLAWWFIDRLVDLWEVWVGQFIVNTPLLWLFYSAMGANIQPSCELDGFVREFDLVTIGDNTSFKYHCLKCRKFSSWERFERGPLMAFRPIVIGNRTKIRGMLRLGARVGDGVYVEKLAVVPEGATVEDNVKLAGNPAFVTDEQDDAQFGNYPCWLPIGILKMVWLLMELGIMYGIWVAAGLVQDTGPADIDTASVDYWLIFGATCILLSLLSSIVIKLLLVGQRRRGKMNRLCACCYHPADWAADYHFRLVTLPFRLFARNSRLCNLVLMLHGMNIDFVSKVEMESFPPSKMDLIRVRRSFIGTVTFDVKSDGIFHQTQIEESSLGQLSHVCADVSIKRAIIPPLSFVNESVMNEKIKKKHRMGHSPAMYLREVMIFVLDLVVLGGVLATAIPAYLIFHVLLEYVNVATFVPITAAALIAQSLSWFVVFWLVQFVAFVGLPWFTCFHPVYKNCADTYYQWSFFRITWGSTLFTTLARMLGAKFEGRAVYLGDYIYDLPLISVAARTVLDGVMVVGHNIVYDRIRFGKSRASGIVRERTFIMADASTARKESGPWHAIAKSTTTVTRKPSMVRPSVVRFADPMDPMFP